MKMGTILNSPGSCLWGRRPVHWVSSGFPARTIAVVEQKEDVPSTEFFPGRLVERESCRKIDES
jgi:hypothetical protein